MTNDVGTNAEDLIRDLCEARERELTLFTDLSDEQLLGSKEHFLEPPIWEAGHVGWFQEYWILRSLGTAKPILNHGDTIYDSFNVSYKLRWDHDFPTRDETLDYLQTVLDRSIDRLDGLNGRVPDENDRYFYWLSTQHEYMHSENLCMVRQTLGYPRPKFEESPIAHDATFIPKDVEIPGGTFQLGAQKGDPFVFDNEKWAHDVEIKPFRIANAAVTNAEFLRFVEAGGYGVRRFWGKHGSEWRRREGATHPMFWRQSNGSWVQKHFDQERGLKPQDPVTHINWYEARAYCAWAGRRLPTEAEWEVAASGYEKRRFPWGNEAPTMEHANLDFNHVSVVDVGAYPEGDSVFGCRQMIGNVWEWTDSKLEGYPEFTPDPYQEYSEPYFGQKPVLRGGGFASRSKMIRNTWRNFFMRHRRNIVAGFRTCALS
jgi:iron(II)-dependent oxidoreductase